MLAKMKKFTFLAYHKDYEIFLQDLRELGLIHVDGADKVIEDDELNQYFLTLKQLRESKKTLQKQLDKKEEIAYNVADLELGKTIPEKIDAIQTQISTYTQQLQVSTKERDALKPWGNFEPEGVDRLEKAGYNISFFIVPDNQYNPEWETLYDAIIINRETSRTYFITITKESNIADKINLEAIKMPDVSLTKLNQLIQELRGKVEEQGAKLKELAKDIPSLDAVVADLEQKIKYTKVKRTTTSLADDKLMMLQGWAPVDNEKEITNYLDSKAVYYQTSEPEPEDDVPIKFKNNKFARLFEPIAELYMLPKYNEIDLTPYFAPFYMFFFGLSLGDIGYGLFLVLVAGLAKFLMRGKLDMSMRGILSLVQVLGASTMVAGMLTGGFFGFSIYELDWSIAQALKDKVFFDNNQMFILSLVLGVIQILFGMVMKVANRIKQQGFVYSLSTIGWLVFLLSCIFGALYPDVMPLFGLAHLIIIAPALILIFFLNTPGKNPFLNFGLGLWDSYNMATGLLGDVLSYVRLFALGLSGGILASVFNSLAAGMSPDNAVLKPIVYVLIFLIGHAINIFMNVLGAIVHPVRLTFVEFYKNAEFEGGGKKYNPFRK
ncbi:MAG TPA: V-type ATPase 116kDa subunit family protein [Salinivirgaceae bacterium]|nr:V-type ATPase 116kDa subunit family protein [Salinivirgaceae bacterium]HQA76088.1 V-type ATPase 116kDa subunit family protein [Salinivirgaceae bacterium]